MREGAIDLNPKAYAQPARQIKAKALFIIIIVIAIGAFGYHAFFVEKGPDSPSNIIEAGINIIPFGDEPEQQLPEDNEQTGAAGRAAVQELAILDYSEDSPPSPIITPDENFIITDITEAPTAQVTIDEEEVPEQLTPEEIQKRFTEGVEEKRGDVLRRRDDGDEGGELSDFLLEGASNNNDIAAGIEDPLERAQVTFVNRYYTGYRIKKLAGGGASRAREGGGNTPNNVPAQLQNLINNNNPATPEEPKTLEQIINETQAVGETGAAPCPGNWARHPSRVYH